MKRSALLFPFLFLAAACHQNGGSVQVQGICAPNSTCSFSGKCEAFALGNPLIDVAAGSDRTLKVFMQLENQLPDNASKDTYRTNTNDAHIEETSIEYSGAMSGKAVFGSGGNVPAGGTSVAEVELVPSFVGSAVPNYTNYEEIIAKLRVRGHYDDGTAFETAEYLITINLCANCTDFGGSCTAYCPQPFQYPACIQ